MNCRQTGTSLTGLYQSAEGSTLSPMETMTGLRVLLANERQERLEAAATVVRRAGHEVVEMTTHVNNVAELIRAADPDVAVVAVGTSEQHALDQIENVAEEATCPVIVLLSENDPGFVAEAAERGAFATALDGSADELQSSMEIALRRFEELRALELAHKRRHVVERAKGILMERHELEEREAFELLRGQARRQQQKLYDLAVAVAVAVVGARPLLPNRGTVSERIDAHQADASDDPQQDGASVAVA